MEKIKMCQHCGTTDNLRVNSTYTRSDGEVLEYYMCKDCRNESRNRWYHRNPSVQKKAVGRWRDKKRATEKALAEANKKEA